MYYNTLVVLAGISLLGIGSGLVGTFAVLRRRALLGDALAHAALPGVCAAFWLIGERNLPLMLVGGFLSGLIGIGAISILRSVTRIKEDASIGIVLGVFYGAGIAFLGWILENTAAGNKAGLETYFLGQTAAMIRQDVLLIGGVSLFCLVLILVMYKEFKVVSFDPEFASAQGWPAFRIDLLLMAMIGLTVMIGLPAVGLVLMAAMLIIPAAAARFWTDRLSAMLALSAVFGMLIGAGGAAVTSEIGAASGPVIILFGVGIFTISMLAAPRRGIIARAIRQLSFRRKIADQSLLRVLYEITEAGEVPALETIQQRKRWSASQLDSVLSRLAGDELLSVEDSGDIRLSEDGQRRAVEVVRGYRLWETFLTEHAESAGNFADLDAESLDEKLPSALVAELEDHLHRAGRFPALPAGHPGGLHAD